MADENAGGPFKLARMYFQNQDTIRELEREGVSRHELRDATRSLRVEGLLPSEENPQFLAEMIAAKLIDSGKPTSINWDKIIELIEKLMPLIQMWLSSCGI